MTSGVTANCLADLIQHSRLSSRVWRISRNGYPAPSEQVLHSTPAARARSNYGLKSNVPKQTPKYISIGSMDTINNMLDLRSDGGSRPAHQLMKIAELQVAGASVKDLNYGEAGGLGYSQRGVLHNSPSGFVNHRVVPGRVVSHNNRQVAVAGIVASAFTVDNQVKLLGAGDRRHALVGEYKINHFEVKNNAILATVRASNGPESEQPARRINQKSSSHYQELFSLLDKR